MGCMYLLQNIIIFLFSLARFYAFLHMYLYETEFICNFLIVYIFIAIFVSQGPFWLNKSYIKRPQMSLVLYYL